MTSKQFEIGDHVKRSSQAGGYHRTKHGEIVEILPPRQAPSSPIKGAGMPRMAISYVVKVTPPSKNPNRPKKPKLYWPVASLLRLAPIKQTA